MDKVYHIPDFNTGYDEELYPEFLVKCSCGWAHCTGTRQEAEKAWDAHINPVIKERVRNDG